MALALAATATEGKWPRHLRCAFITGVTVLLWIAIYGVSLALS